jgi:NhaP-type Na+/H+ or K+/H+ antiporter
VTTNQILIEVGLILALAAGSQVLASRLRIPAIIVLLPAGFVAGALTSDVNPQDLLLGMSRGAAVMLGIILVVSGPTVVGPLLGFVRPTERLQQVLIWEGSLIDPVGGILGALVFHALSRAPAKDRAASSCNLRPAPASAWPAAWPAPRCSGCCSAGSGSAKCSAPPRSSPR